MSIAGFGRPSTRRCSSSSSVQQSRPCSDLELVAVGEEHSTPSIGVFEIPGLGGSTKTHGEWNAYVAMVHNSASSDGIFRVLPPFGGCNALSGHLTQTSRNARENRCDIAINGSPFAQGGGCIGQSISSGLPVCKDCIIADGIPSLGLRSRREGQNATWVIGTGLSYAVAENMTVSNVISGHLGWLVRSGITVQNLNGKTAPRSAIGVSKDGKTLVLFVVDGCEHCPSFLGGPKGLSLRQLADQMVQLGAWHAINLDGGGSSTFVVDGRVINFPLSADIPFGPIRQERAVSTVVCIKLPTPGDLLSAK